MNNKGHRELIPRAVANIVLFFNVSSRTGRQIIGYFWPILSNVSIIGLWSAHYLNYHTNVSQQEVRVHVNIGPQLVGWKNQPDQRTLFKAVCFIVSARLVGRGFRFPIESKLQTWNLADHQALPSLVFLPSSICSGSSNVTPASVVLLSTSLSALPPPPPLVSPLPPFTQLMPRYTDMHACTHPLRIPALSPSLAFSPNIKWKNISFIFLISGSLAKAHISSPALDLTSPWTKVLWRLLLMNFIQKELLCICCFISIPVWLFQENEFRSCEFAFMQLCQICFLIHVSVFWSSFIAHLLAACLAFAFWSGWQFFCRAYMQPPNAAVSSALSSAL